MEPSPNAYLRLPGRGVRRAIFALAATRCRLWLGSDHLLAIDATTASEEYRRFYFRDIEAFVIRRTAGRARVNGILLFLALITLGPLLYFWRVEGSAGWMGAAMPCGLLWGILALANTLRGPTTETTVRTAVQSEKLPSLGRLPVARKVLARIAPLINAAQGATTQEELATAPWMAAAGSTAAGVFRHEKGTLHYALFAALLADAASTVAAYGFLQTALTAAMAVSTVATLAGFLLAVTAVIRQGDTDLPASVRVVTKSALVLYLLSFAAGLVFTVSYTIHHPGEQVRTGLEIIHEPGFATVAMIAAGISAVLGLAGFAVMRAPRTPPHDP